MAQGSCPLKGSFSFFRIRLWPKSLVARLGRRGFWVRCETPEVRASSGFRSRAQALNLRFTLNPKSRNPAFGSRFSVRGLRFTTFDGLEHVSRIDSQLIGRSRQYRITGSGFTGWTFAVRCGTRVSDEDLVGDFACGLFVSMGFGTAEAGCLVPCHTRCLNKE